jgi:ERF superfamily protein
MQRSSPSIAALATALAKAQIELTNPEKSLIGTIEPQRGEGSARQFRYAPLSSGLEIVRRTLGQHEIATVQTTAVDQAAGMVNLTTVLAHSSGEWIASDWPVCPIAETERPHRMGAALTYARRYALFTLVGIAGEDDLDAPNPLGPSPQTEKPRTNSSTNGGLQGAPDGPAGRVKAKKLGSPTLKRELSAALSASLRTELLGEIENLGAVDDAALWVKRRLPAKSQLSATDAQQVEEAFAAKLVTLQPETAAVGLQVPAENTRIAEIDKSVLAFPEPRRIRDRDHMRHVIKQACLVCGRLPSDPHHLRFAQSRALARKVSDEFTVPLCRAHHREIHRCGNEALWWRSTGIDPLRAARALWLETHPLPRGEGMTTYDKSTGEITVAGVADQQESRNFSPNR